MLKTIFKKTFDIREGEIRISLLMQFYIFLIITVLLIVKPTVTALFLSKLGASQLPYGYILVAIVAVLTSYFYNKLVKRISLQNLTIGTLFFFSIAFLVLSFVIQSPYFNTWVLYVYYVFISIFAVLTTSQFWLIGNLVYNAREAKRLFGFIGSGAIAGGIFGGYITTILAPLTGNSFLMILAACLILLCIPILKAVWFLRIRRLNRYVIQQRQYKDNNKTQTTSFRLILNSRHLSLLALIVGVGVIMAKLVDFQFSDFAANKIPDSERLASFFGFWFSTFNVAALCIQLFLTNRIVSFLGVSSTLLILPISIALGCLVFLAVPELAVLIVIKGLDGGLKQSLNKAAIELSILPIPFHIKDSAKAFIDVVVDSIATGLTGIILLFFIRKLALDSTYITIIILFFLFGWILLIYKLRDAYFNSFRINLQQTLAAEQEETLVSDKGNNVQSANTILTKGSELEILTLLERLESVKIKNLKESVIKLLDHPSNRVKTAAVNQLYAFKKRNLVHKIRPLLSIKDDELVVASLNYLLFHTHLDEEELFKNYLDHNTDYIANAALLCLAKESRQNYKLAAKYDLDRRIALKIKELSHNQEMHREEETAELLITIGYARKPKFYSFISVNFYHKSDYIAKHAIKAAGLTAAEHFILPLLNFLQDRSYRRRTIKALQSYGSEITKTLLLLDKDDQLPLAVKKYIPKVIGSFYNETGVKILFRLLQSKDITTRQQASKSLLRIHRKKQDIAINKSSVHKYLYKESITYKNTINGIISLEHHNNKAMGQESNTCDIKVEQQIARNEVLLLLKHQLELSLSTLMNLLSLLYDQTDMKVVYSGLKSELKEAKMNAIEFLDNMLQTKMKLKILPLIEFHATYMQNQQYKEKTDIYIMDEFKCLALLLKNRGKTMKLAVLNLIFQLADKRYKKSVLSLRKHKSREVQQSVFKTLEVFSDKEYVSS